MENQIVSDETFGSQVTVLKSWKACVISFNISSFLISKHFLLLKMDLYIVIFDAEY